MNNDIVDLQELKEIMDDDMELIKECFAEFVQDWPQNHENIKTAILEKNFQNLDAYAHKLKGTLKYLAANAAANAAHALESAGKENDLEGIDNKLEALEEECLKLKDYIKNF